MSQIQANETKEQAYAEQKPEPRIIKPVFRIIHADEIKQFEADSMAKNLAWSTEEHLKFIEAVQKHGKQWSYLQDIIPTKSPAQIRAHAHDFMAKIERVAGNIDPIEYIKSKPADYFASSSFEKAVETSGKYSRKRDLTCSFHFTNDLECTPKKKKSGSEIIPAHSLDPPPLPSASKTAESAPAAIVKLQEEVKAIIQKENVEKPQIRRTVKKKQKEKPVKQAVQEPAPAPPVPNEEEKAMQESCNNNGMNGMNGMNNMNGPAGAYPPSASPAAVPATAPVGTIQYHQYPNVPGKLMDIFRDLAIVSSNLTNEKPSCRSLIDTDPQFRYYWEALETCSSSLQNIITDIYYIHVSAQPVQAQYMYPPQQQPAPQAQLYYAQPADQRAGGYMQAPQTAYYQEKPAGAEY